MADEDPLIGKELGNYVVRSLIGRGGMGAVYEAEHKLLHDRAAIKVLHASHARSAGANTRFFQEARSARDIGHPSIVQIFDFGETPDGDLYLVMELLVGQSLTARLAQGPLPETEVIRIGAAVADGLQAAHSKGIIHRDLKPDNLFLVGDRVKILDFGIAKVISSSSTNTGSILGTPLYMAPEQGKGAKLVSFPADMFSLGNLLFEMITGRTPILADDIPAIFSQLFFDTPPLPSSLASLSPDLERIILRCLEKDPKARYADMAELRDNLLSCPAAPEGAAVVARRSLEQRPPTMSTVTGSVGEIQPAEPEEELPRSRRSLGLGLGAAAVVVSAALMFVARPTGGPARPKALPPVAAVSPPSPTAAGVAPALVKLVSSPPGAQIFVDGKAIGVAPTEISVSLPWSVELRLEGHESVRRVIASPGEVSVSLPPLAGEATRPKAEPAHDSSKSRSHHKQHQQLD